MSKITELRWKTLLRRIKEGQCTPFLGAGACYGTLPLAAQLAREWANEHDYPLDDRTDLARVAQFIAIAGDAMTPKEELAEKLQGTPPPDFSAPAEPHALLADLPLPVYLTTNYDDFMFQALTRAGKSPKRELCRWKDFEYEPSVFEDDSYQPDASNPVVFHLHGSFDAVESMVLTEDDYLDFLINISQDEKLLPPRIHQAFANASLLFVGYGIRDWNFRVIFRKLKTYERLVSSRRGSIAVQLEPADESDDRRRRAQEYLESYFETSQIWVYWGTAAEFTEDLKRRWRELDVAD